MIEFEDPQGRIASEIAYAILDALYPGQDEDVEWKSIAGTGRWQLGSGDNFLLYELDGGGYRLIPKYGDAESLAGLRLLLKSKVGVTLREEGGPDV